MKNTILISFFFLISIFSFGQTQFEMNAEQSQNFLQADKELNQVYGKITKEYKSKPEFLAKLKISQNLWIKFRDAEMNALYPEKDKLYSYGSSFPMCWNAQLTAITKERIKALRVWLDGIEEGDTCAGSVKWKG